MGWVFTSHQRKAEFVRERTAPWQTEEVRGTTLVHCLRGSCLWKVVEIERLASDGRDRYIALDLLAYQGGTWGYKDPCEAVHPYYYSCPLGYLDMVPVACDGWRALVRAYHARMSRRFEVGQQVVLLGWCIPWARITSVRPLRGEYAGQRYRLRRALLGDVMAQVAP